MLDGIPEKHDTASDQSDTGNGRARLFLSHASEDAEAARELARHLRAGGIRVWLDLDEIKPGDQWMQRLEEGLLSCDHYAVYIGRLGIINWVSCELRVALDRNVKEKQYRIIPILGAGADPQSLPLFLKQHHWLDLRDKAVNPAVIVSRVQEILGLPEISAPTGEAPFIGLRAFDTAHAHLFFGREREIAELLERLKTSAFLTLIGDSGSGKSSLLKAGLIPSLRSGTHTGGDAHSPVWRVVVIRPGTQPFRELANALPDLRTDFSPQEKLALTDTCHIQLASGTQGLSMCIGALTQAGQRTVVAVDQFEELFTLVSDKQERQRFIDSLLQAANIHSDHPVQIVITLRADYYAECLHYPELIRSMAADQYAVRPITGEDLVDVIEKPAARTGVTLENGLVEAILADLGTDGLSLALLEHTLLQLWNRRSSNLLTHDSYEAIGRVQGALEHHAEEVFCSFTESEQMQARNLFLTLVQPGKNKGATLRRVSKTQLLPSGSGHDEADKVLSALVRHRAINIYSTSQEEEYGIAHEDLVDGWQRLNNWLDEDREFLFWRQRLNSALATWEESGGDAGTLLRGAPLMEAMRWQKQRAPDLSQTSTAFIKASASKETRIRRLKRTAIAGLAVLTGVAVSAALIATKARQQAEDSLQLATSAVDEMLIRVGSDTLKDIPQLENIRKDLLTEARLLYERLAEQHARNPDLKLQAAIAPARIAAIDSQLGEMNSASTALEEAISKLESLAMDNPDTPVYQAELATLHNDLGRVLETLAETQEQALRADQHFSQAIAMQQALVASEPQNSQYLLDNARTFLNRGILYKEKLADPIRARQDLEHSVALVEPLINSTEPPSRQTLQHLARSNNTLANLFAEQNDPAAALLRYEQAAEFFNTLHLQDSVNREYQLELAKTYNNMAILFTRDRNADNDQKSTQYNNQAIALFAKLADPLPEFRVELANAYDVRGRILLGQENFSQAVVVFTQADQLMLSVLEDFPDNTNYAFRYAVILTNLGYSQILDSQTTEVPKTQGRLSELLGQLSPENRTMLENQNRYRTVQTWN